LTMYIVFITRTNSIESAFYEYVSSFSYDTHVVWGLLVILLRTHSIEHVLVVEEGFLENGNSFD
jgi:hypothetical protein